MVGRSLDKVWEKLAFRYFPSVKAGALRSWLLVGKVQRAPSQRTLQEEAWGALVVMGSVGTRQAESETVEMTDDLVKCEPGR